MSRTISVEPLSTSVGALVGGIDADQLAADDALAAEVLAALEQYGVLVFRSLDLDPVRQVAFSQRLGEIDYEPGHHEVRGIYRVTLDKSKNSSADYLKGTFDWHMDGCTPLHGEPPQKATVLSAKQVSAVGGETEFGSTYAAYDALSDDEKERFSALHVLHCLEATQRRVTPDPTAEQLAAWRRRPTSTHPLIWTHRSGRRSLVIGAHADHVVELEPDDGQALLNELLDRTTAADRIYRHKWSIGDTVIWDNTGVVHRATPYAPDSDREMLRTTVFGDEPIA
jgi:alpha-ketoglutarate-dependent taurine dioxygenase